MVLGMKCQSILDGKRCNQDATHEVNALIADDSLGSAYQMLATNFVLVELCDEHAGFEHELRTVEDATPIFQPDACPYCARPGVCGPLAPGGLLIHTIPGTFDLCEGQPTP